MKALMNAHVDQERHVMFQQSAGNVRKKLVDLIGEVEEFMKEKADEVFVNIKRDYRVGLGGHDVQNDGDILPRTQRAVRKEIQRILDGAEEAFMIALDLQLEENDGRKDDSERGDMDIEGPCDGSDDNAHKEKLDLSPGTKVKPPGHVVSREGAHMVSNAASEREAVASGAYMDEDSYISSSPRVSKLESG